MDAAPTRVDVLVLGAGMAGLAAAAVAAAAGARVLAVEKGPRPGGSAALSAGIFWTAPDGEALRRRVPLGDPALGRAVVVAYPAAVEAVRAAGVTVSEPFHGVMGFGVGHKVDLPALFGHELAVVERAGGRVRCATAGRRLLAGADGAVGGALLAGPGGPLAVEADATILATGGFQGAPDLVTTYLGPLADRMLVRSNPGSVGDGLRLGRAAGAATSRAMGSFYGHLLPSPLESFGERDYLPFTQYHSSHCILVNRLGRRFCDESAGDEVSNQAVLAQPDARAVLLCDERVRTAHVVTAPYPHGGVVDRFAEAATAGARLVAAGSLAELAELIAAWGVPAANLRETLDGYAAAAAGEPGRLDAPLPAAPEPLVEPPFHALEVQPSITFTYGGLRVEPGGRVLDHDGLPVPGLLAAGVDAGGLSNWTYAGGLAPAFITGRLAATTALAATTTARSAAGVTAGSAATAGGGAR